jgi:AcrR family transcriptional regulator
LGTSKHSILSKSRELFEQHGYGKTTLTDIAKSIGKVKSALYYYFSGKEEIFAQIVKDESSQFWDSLESAIQTGDTVEDQLHIYVHMRVELMQKIAKRYSFLKQEFFELMPIVDENRQEADKLEKDAITALLLSYPKYKEIEEKTVRFKAEMLVNTIKGLEVQMYVTDQVLIDQKSLPIFSDVLLNGIL